MDKYSNMKNPSRFSGEWKLFAFSFLDLLTPGGCFFWAKMANNLVHSPLFFALLNYGPWIVIALVTAWRPYNNPVRRQIFTIIESIFFVDKNHYHALSLNRNYHGTYKEDE